MIRHAPHRGLRCITDARSHLRAPEIIVDRPVQIDLASLYENHESCGGDGLRDRSQCVHCVLGGVEAPLPVGPAESFLPDDLAIACHRHRDRTHRSLGLDQFFPDEASNAIEPIGDTATSATHEPGDGLH